MFLVATAAMLCVAAVATPVASQQKPRSSEATGYHGMSWAVSASVTFDENGEPVRSLEDFPTVASVRPCSPAHRVGIEPGDKLVDVDGRDLGEPGPLFEKIRPGVTYRLVIERGGELSEVEMTLTERPADDDVPNSVLTAPVGSLEDWNCPATQR